MIYVNPLISVPSSFLIYQKIKQSKIGVYQSAFKGLCHFCLVAPFTMCSFFYMTAYLKTFDKEIALNNLKTKYKKAVSMGIICGPVINFVAYHFFPFHLRYLCFDFFAFIWAIILSLINNNYLKFGGKNMA